MAAWLQTEMEGSELSERALPVKTKPRVERNRVLVTGGAGFVGSHLCDYLVRRGDQVWAGGAVGAAQQGAPRATSMRAAGQSFGLLTLQLGCALLRASAGRVARLRLHCAKAPAARGPQVICVDNFFTGSKENIKHLLDKPNFELLRHDVVEKLLLEVDQIYHLACPASPVHYK